MASPESPNTVKDAAAPAAEDQAAPAAEARKKGPLSALTSLSPRNRMIVSVIGVLLALALVEVTVLKPLRQHLGRLSASIDEKEKLIPQKLAVLNRKSEIEKSHSDHAGYVTDSKLSREEEIAAYLGEIERVSQKVGLFVSNINPVQTEESGSAYYLKVDVEGAGSVANIKQFIADLERSNPPVRVSGFSLRGQGSNSDELRYRFSITKLGLRNPA